MRRSAHVGVVVALATTAAMTTAPAAQARHADEVTTVVGGLSGPRDVVSVSKRVTLVTTDDGRVNLVREHRHRAPTVSTLTSVSPGFGAAIAKGRHHSVWILTGAAGPPGTPGSEGAAKLYRWHPGLAEPQLVKDIAAYQAGDPDPYDLESLPGDSNPYGLAALRDGSVLVADAAGNDLLRVEKDGDTRTVARLKPRAVAVPEGLPSDGGEEGPPPPPAGTVIPSEAVATSVTVGPDGAWYVGELRGFPATPGTSQVWRIRPGSVGAVCDPERPDAGRCTRYADGLTSIVDLSSHGSSVYAISLSKKSWLAVETGVPGAEIGGLFRISRWGRSISELAAGSLVLPGGVSMSRRGDALVTGPVFGPGQLLRIG